MKPPDHAVLLLAKAQQDIYAYTALMNDPGVADEILGFHAQQVVEKTLKAVLARNGILFPYTHDLLPLIDLLQGANIGFPFELETVLKLVPYAVAFRYDEAEDIALDRHACQNLISAIVKWGREIIEK